MKCPNEKCKTKLESFIIDDSKVIGDEFKLILECPVCGYLLFGKIKLKDLKKTSFSD